MRSASRDPTDPPRAASRPATAISGLYWLFAIPFVATLLPWIYNTDSPELIGIPFFYWYQMAWVPVTVVITVFVYRRTKGS